MKTVTETWEIVDMPELHLAFQLTKKITFDVEFYRLSTNKHQYFAT